jgi:hypothetical protein
MRSNNDVEKIVKKDLDVRASDGTHERMRRAVLGAHGLSQTNAAASMPMLAGRMLMRNSIVKSAIAAALIAVVGLGILEFLGTGGKSGVVWAEVARKVQASRGVIFRATEHITPDTYDQQVDFSMQYCTSTQSRLDGYRGGAIIKTIYSDCNTKTATLVGHDHKSYVKMTFEKTMPDSFGMPDPNRWVQRFLSCKYKDLGQKTIDGVLCEGIETTDPAFYGDGNPPESPVARLWVSVETRYPVRFEGERVYDDQRHTFVQDQFEWDVEIDGSLFEPNIPAGYLDISPY